MKTTRSSSSSSSSMMLFPFALLLILAAVAPSLAQGFDFFYFVQEWQGGCDGNQSCCYPTTGKFAPSFGIHGLWPSYNNGSYPSNCDRTIKFDTEEMTDLIPLLESDWPTLACPSSDSTKLWEHEWKKHGTCCNEPAGSKSIIFYPYKYFETALLLRRQVNLFEILVTEEIAPENGRFYSLDSITNAISKALGGFTPGITCNVDASGNSQLYQIYVCVDASGSKLIKCPVPSRSLSQKKKCASQVEFPYFFIFDEISMVTSN